MSMPQLRTLFSATWLCILYPVVNACWWRQRPEIPLLYRGGTAACEPTGVSRNANDATIPGSDLRSQGDSIIECFERELIKIRQEIAIEAEEEMLAICEAALEKRKVELRKRHHLATSVDTKEDGDL